MPKIIRTNYRSFVFEIKEMLLYARLFYPFARFFFSISPPLPFQIRVPFTGRTREENFIHNGTPPAQKDREWKENRGNKENSRHGRRCVEDGGGKGRKGVKKRRT